MEDITPEEMVCSDTEDEEDSEKEKRAEQVWRKGYRRHPRMVGR